mmetsp:Transcript_1244/g.3569  ORF Transcript_1244/g.3569 Transcript_1244/m.3569 type:complete len:214 (+) Transcript_1244:453-1094(+)
MTRAWSTAPICSSAPARRSTRCSPKTPMTTCCADAAFVRGPRRLKAVRTPKALRIGATAFIAGWFLGAYRNPSPTFSMHAATSSSSRSKSSPRASRTSAAPHFDDTERLPHFVTFAPSAAHRIADAVDKLIVDAPSPPVPTMSSSFPDASTGTHASSIAAAAPLISAGLSPLRRSKHRIDATCSGFADPSRNAPNIDRHSSLLSSAPSTNFDK